MGKRNSGAAEAGKDDLGEKKSAEKTTFLIIHVLCLCVSVCETERHLLVCTLFA